MSIQFLPLGHDQIKTYVSVGVQSYYDHYLHLWKNNDPVSFINQNLTETAVVLALEDANQFLYLIYFEGTPVGILKLVVDAQTKNFDVTQNVLLSKIYLIKEFSGIGIGKQALQFVEGFAQEHQRPWVWLYAMKKGRALQFYQKNGYQIKGESDVKLPNIIESEKAMWLLAKKIQLTNPYE